MVVRRELSACPIDTSISWYLTRPRPAAVPASGCSNETVPEVAVGVEAFDLVKFDIGVLGAGRGGTSDPQGLPSGSASTTQGTSP